ncbi:MAG: ABC transporter permease [Spirochaetes bacterium]|nr:ABC transporter permease [Spirochaetota bacterium]
MISFIVKRIIVSILIVFIIITLTFFLVRFAKGGPFDFEKKVTPEVKKQLMKKYGMDKPILVQYLKYMGRLIQLDFDKSTKYPDRTVAEIIRENLPYSITIGLLSLLLSVSIGIPLGLIASKKPEEKLDHLLQTFSILFVSLPRIVIAPLAIMFFSFTLGILPSGLWGGPLYLILPVITLSIPFIAKIFLLTRNKAISIRSSQFILAARARGLSEQRIFFTHILKNSMIPVIAFLAPGAAMLLTGSVVIEIIFVLPGLGKYFVQAAFNRDYALITGVVIVYSTLLVFLNMLADISLQFIDPRTKIFGDDS